MTRVLVVDDEAPIRRAMAANLRARGYDVDLAETGEQALQLAARHHPDVVLLDLGLPGMDGLAVIDGLRGWSQVPIVVLSARGSERDKVAALDAGADDYVSKPFGMDELLARLRAAVRRAAVGDEATVVTTDDFTVDLGTKQVLDAAGEPVRLTPTEWQLLEMLVRHRGKLVTQRQLLQDVWGPALWRPSRPPPSPPRPPPPEARARPLPSPLPHHRGRHGLPLHRPQLTGPTRAPRRPDEGAIRHGVACRLRVSSILTRRTCSMIDGDRRPITAAPPAATRREHRLDLVQRFREDSGSPR